MVNETVAEGDRLSIDLIRRTLSGELIGRRICVLWDVSSTNDVLRQMAEAGAPAGTVVLSERQHAGRGRGETSWFSPLGVNLYASVLLRPAIPVAAVRVFSFIGSLAVSDAIRLEGLPALIKWPNDIFVDRRKVAGLLNECAAVGEKVEHVILGFGVSLNVDRDLLNLALGGGAGEAASLRELIGRDIDRNAFAGRLLMCVDRWVHVYTAQGSEAILAGWRERDALIGHRVVVCRGGAECRGRVRGISREGFLLVEGSDGGAPQIVNGQIRVLD
ncbi:MAG: biotin--[acetyl-CoA-carboxylase] ligase [Candidatus Rokuibacteriota bacterium]|nr:MAG: biotin--[acetyl-CoA-carboxylase] ligase [Candidatus Rokubacteria bacterium]